MNSFEDVTLKWNGKEYKIPSDKMLRAIARVEDIVTLPELRAFAQRGGAPISKLSMAYGSMLRYAGADVTDEEIYFKMADGGNQHSVIMIAMSNVISLMVPPSLRKAIEDVPSGTPGAAEDQDAGNAQQPGK